MRNPTSMLLVCSRLKKIINISSFLNEFSRSNYQARGFSSFDINSDSRNGQGVEIISVENIGPASPTPHHLKTYRVSMFDQHIHSAIYSSFLFFYSNKYGDQNGSSESKKRVHELLKSSLSKTLTRFYPFAGKIDGEMFIDCNDDGAYYAEAKINKRLSDYLINPDANSKISQSLLPVKSSIKETYVVMIQATIFECGGISIGMHTAHKIIDGYSLSTFLNAWAATARAASEEIKEDNNIICPNFIISSTIFPPNPTIDSMVIFEILQLCPKRVGKATTRRFVFSDSSLKTLKKETGARSRVMAVIGLIWKCIMATSFANERRNDSILMFPVNLRSRTVPPFPTYSIGNVFLTSFTRLNYADDYNAKLGLASIVGIVQNTVDQVDCGLTEKLKGENGYLKMQEYNDDIKLTCSQGIVEQVSITSTCNSGLNEADFGWGKPIWVSIDDAGLLNTPAQVSMISLMDTSNSRNGIEAWVTLGDKDMAVLERDVDLLAFASLNPSPLQM